jgi:hypothetical protein
MKEDEMGDGQWVSLGEGGGKEDFHSDILVKEANYNKYIDEK